MKQVTALSRYDPRNHLDQLAGIPTLVASATFDPIATPESGRMLAESIPGARYIEWLGQSHGVVIRDAPRVNAVLKEHIGESESLFGLARTVP